MLLMDKAGLYFGVDRDAIATMREDVEVNWCCNPLAARMPVWSSLSGPDVDKWLENIF